MPDVGTTFYMGSGGLSSSKARMMWGPRPEDFGAVGSGSVNDGPAIQAFFDHIFSTDRYQRVEMEGRFATREMITMGPSGGVDGLGPKFIYGAPGFYGNAGGLRPAGTAAAVIKMQNLQYTTFYGAVSVGQKFGGGTDDWTDDIKFTGFQCGLWSYNCPDTTFKDGLGGGSAPYFSYAAYGGNNDRSYFGRTTLGGGSGYNNTVSLIGTASSSTNFGTAGSRTQYTRITIDTLPPVWTDDWHTPGSGYPGFLLRSKTETNVFYRVMDWNRTNGTVDVFPWISPAEDSAINGAGADMIWHFGGGLLFDGVSDAGTANGAVIEQLDQNGAGIGLMPWTQYEPVVHNFTGQSVGVCLLVDNAVGTGGRYSNLYMENNRKDIILVNAHEEAHRIIDGEYALSPESVLNLSAARMADDTLSYQGDNILKNTTFTWKGRTLRWDGTYFDYPDSTREQRWDPTLQPLTTLLSDRYDFLLDDPTAEEIQLQRLFTIGARSFRVIHTTTGAAPDELTFTLPGTPPTSGGYGWWDGDTAATKTYRIHRDYPSDAPVTAVVASQARTKLWYVGLVVPGNAQIAKTARSEAGTAYTIEAADRDTTIILSEPTSAVTVTVPTNASDSDCSVGFRTSLFCQGSGGITLSTTGITVTGPTTLAQNERLNLEKTATDTWLSS